MLVGTTKVKIEDITNGYETEITIKVKTESNTDTVTHIYNIDDLVKFRDSVNAGNNYAGKTVYVMADIDMSPACSETVGSWTPIGATGTVFAGTFDGNYHTLSNLYYNSNAYRNVGLFVQNNGVIQNLILEKIYIYSYQIGNEMLIGGIVSINAGTIQNIGINNGTIEVIDNIKDSSSNWRIIYAGGITGYNGKDVISCYNKANIKTQTEDVLSTVTYSGGITARNSGKIDNCYNIGSISGLELVGNITGWSNANGGSSQDINCYTTNVTVTGLNNGSYTSFDISCIFWFFDNIGFRLSKLEIPSLRLEGLVLVSSWISF